MAAEPLAALHLARGQPVLAVALIERRIEASGEDLTTAPLLRLLVDAKVAMGDLDGAAAAAGRLSKIAEGSRRPSLQAAALLATARVGLACGGSPPTTALEKACSAFEGLGMPFDAALARLEWARALSGSEPEVAAEDARQARATFERLGARPHADEAAALLRDLGAGSGPGPRAGGELTRREQEVLDLVSHGLTNLAIGERLFISPKTVEHHVGRVLSKLGLRSRSEAVAWVLRHPPSKSGDK